MSNISIPLLFCLQRYENEYKFMYTGLSFNISQQTLDINYSYKKQYNVW